MKKIFLIFIITSTTFSIPAQDFSASAVKSPELDSITKDSLIKVLIKVDQADQYYRNQMSYVEETYGTNSKEMVALYDSMNLADSIGLIKVSAILDHYGWIGEDAIGDQANTALFMVIQHSDLQTQEKYLPMMRQAVKDGKAKASELALLEDRVALLQGKRQTYGSQIIWSVKTATFCVAPLEDPDNVDVRRNAVGLPPLSVYLTEMDLKWDVEQYKKDLPGIEAEFFKVK